MFCIDSRRVANIVRLRIGDNSLEPPLAKINIVQSTTYQGFNVPILGIQVDDISSACF